MSPPVHPSSLPLDLAPLPAPPSDIMSPSTSVEIGCPGNLSSSGSSLLSPERGRTAEAVPILLDVGDVAVGLLWETCIIEGIGTDRKFAAFFLFLKLPLSLDNDLESKGLVPLDEGASSCGASLPFTYGIPPFLSGRYSSADADLPIMPIPLPLPLRWESSWSSPPPPWPPPPLWVLATAPIDPLVGPRSTAQSRPFSGQGRVIAAHRAGRCGRGQQARSASTRINFSRVERHMRHRWMV
jgi:hypothetical protein